MLSTHFWSLQQRHDFALQDHKKCVQHFRPTFRCMQARTSSVSDQDQQENLSKILSKLASGVHPTVEEILGVKILFQREPFHLNCLYPRHKVRFRYWILDYHQLMAVSFPESAFESPRNAHIMVTSTSTFRKGARNT